MKAVRVAKVRRGEPTGLHAVHLLLDPGRTYCGLHVDELQVVDELDVERLPAGVEACMACGRVHEGWPREMSPPAERVISNPAPGRFRKAGPLNHGTRRRGGRQL